MVRKLIISIVFLMSGICLFAQGNFMFNQHGSLSAEIDTDTYLYIYFDASGSMNSTLAPLQEMQSNYLQDSLIQFYNNDVDIYTSHVSVLTFNDEKTFLTLNKETQSLSIAGTKKIVNIVFQDESTPYSAEDYFPTTPTSTYLSDIEALRDSTVDFIGTLKYTGIIFQVNYSYNAFKEFLQATEYGTGNYAGVNGLSDRLDQFVYYYDITNGGTAVYYTNLLMSALRELGFNL